MDKPLLIGVAGSSDSQPTPESVEKARRFGERLSSYKGEVLLISGGDGGLMRIVSEAFIRGGGKTIGILPIEDERRMPGDPRYNPYNTIPILSGMTFQSRSIMLVRSSHSFVVLGGGAGTLIEAFLAYIYRIPLIILTGTGYITDRLKEFAHDGYLDHRRINKAIFTDDPEEAAEKAYTLAKHYVRSV